MPEKAPGTIPWGLLGASLLTAGIRFGYQFVKAVIAAGEEKTAFQDEKGD